MHGSRKRIVKKTVDVMMTILLLCLMAYQVTGEALHEWCGIGMTVLLIVHHILNGKWSASLFKGKYNAYRIVSTAVNALLFVSIALTAVCGMAMSAKAVPFLYGILPVSFARRFHLSMSYWSFVLMGFHLGLHVPAMTAGWKLKRTVRTILAAAFTVISGLGFMLFVKSGIPGYLFFRSPFAFFDYEKSVPTVFAENLAVLTAFAFLGACCVSLLKGEKKGGQNKRFTAAILILVSLLIGTSLLLFDGGKREAAPSWGTSDPQAAGTAADKTKEEQPTRSPEDDGFILLPGGTFTMGSPETENWRIADETAHTVTVTAFRIDPCETTGEDYARLMGEDPSAFSGENLPVEQVSWLDAVLFANAKSKDAGLTPVYTVDENGVAWDRSADGYRLPTEAEWEYACRAGTETPFNTEKSMDADEANFYGHYPYEIEENYFDDSVLEARPGVYRQTALPVGSFAPNGWGLYDMHGNVNEWCWDCYGAYDPQIPNDPSGPESGTRHVYRGGGWNDFGKNMRSAYRAAGQSDLKAANLGIRLVRNAEGGIPETVTAAETVRNTKAGGRVLIAYFSWGSNTRGIAEEIEMQTGADLYEITPIHPYSDSYNTVLMEAQEDQHKNARPELADPPESIDAYDVILLGYPNWWASIPMPIASFLESYDFSGKTIVPFCSHGGGRFGQSLTAIAKLAPDAVMGDGLSVHYSGGASLPDDVAAWLDRNGIERK